MSTPWPLLLLFVPSLILAQTTHIEQGSDSQEPAEQQIREALAGIDAGAKEDAQLAAAGRSPRGKAPEAEKFDRLAAARERQHANGVKLGMTPRQVHASRWGSPNHVHQTRSSAGVHEQWVYPQEKYLYFRNGLLSTIQNITPPSSSN